LELFQQNLSKEVVMITELVKHSEVGQELQKVEDLLVLLRPELPIQNPMPFFVHNNPLQFWEKFRFEMGVESAILTYENTIEDKARSVWRELEDFVIPLILTYVDQGLNRWCSSVPKTSLWSWYLNYIDSSYSLKSRALVKLKSQLPRLRKDEPMVVVARILSELCTDQADWNAHLRTLVFHFKGWSGMINVLEQDPSLFPIAAVPISLKDWVAVLVTACDAFAETKPMQTKPMQTKPLWDLKKVGVRRRGIQQHLEKIRSKEMAFYRETIRRLEKQVQGHLLVRKGFADQERAKRTEVQVLFCIDDREESLRRALEVTNSDYETFGTVGFFGVDFSLKRPSHLIFQPQCPPVIKPRKRARELAALAKADGLRSLRRLLPLLNESRFSLVEPLLALVAWPLYASALLMRSFSPKLYRRLREWLRLDHYLEPNNRIEFLEPYSLEEKVEIVAGILGGCGLKGISSEFVVVVGHAATTTNNPFQKSYGCGACSGQSGFANAKVFAQFANDAEVRLGLGKRGVNIEKSVTFLAACHDTCADHIHYGPHEPEDTQAKNEVLNKFKIDMQAALNLNKLERWTQFHLANDQSPGARASDWSEPRPEFGHTGVALSIFGPRWLTKGLNLFRRAFLVSYEPDLDSDGKDLEFNILNALPVCANINLDYFTSSAFPEALGAGSKLPLNIAAGIGLMAGSKGDLRIGLATQMIDQHEPLRLLAVVYCEEQKLVNVIKKSIRLKSLLANNWIHLIRIDPMTLKLHVLTEELKNELALTH
jgi:uncharacterized protein YbcC (UPF0753/DUF2309 family)